MADSTGKFDLKLTSKNSVFVTGSGEVINFGRGRCDLDEKGGQFQLVSGTDKRLQALMLGAIATQDVETGYGAQVGSIRGFKHAWLMKIVFFTQMLQTIRVLEKLVYGEKFAVKMLDLALGEKSTIAVKVWLAQTEKDLREASLYV